MAHCRPNPPKYLKNRLPRGAHKIPFTDSIEERLADGRMELIVEVSPEKAAKMGCSAGRYYRVMDGKPKAWTFMPHGTDHNTTIDELVEMRWYDRDEYKDEEES